MSDTKRPIIIESKPPRSGSEDPAAKRLRNRKILKYLLIAFLSVDAIMCLALVYVLFLHMPYFNLQQVDVTGNRRLSRPEVTKRRK